MALAKFTINFSRPKFHHSRNPFRDGRPEVWGPRAPSLAGSLSSRIDCLILTAQQQSRCTSSANSSAKVSLRA